jgi:hypothetical protein
MSGEIDREDAPRFERVRITYFFDGSPFAERFRFRVPRQGEEVRFRKISYRITRVVWIEDEPTARVAIDIEEVKP